MSSAFDTIICAELLKIFEKIADEDDTLLDDTVCEDERSGNRVSK